MRPGDSNTAGSETRVKRAAGALTPREKEITRLVSAGLRNKEIAVKLFVSEGTVKTHLHHIYEKLKVRNRIELSIYQRQRGLS
jgi:DNA-binding NarL/FixJ family response regulator